MRQRINCRVLISSQVNVLGMRGTKKCKYIIHFYYLIVCHKGSHSIWLKLQVYNISAIPWTTKQNTSLSRRFYTSELSERRLKNYKIYISMRCNGGYHQDFTDTDIDIDTAYQNRYPSILLLLTVICYKTNDMKKCEKVQKLYFIITFSSNIKLNYLVNFLFIYNAQTQQLATKHNWNPLE